MMIIREVNPTDIGVTIKGSRAIEITDPETQAQNIGVLDFKVIVNTTNGLVIATEHFTYSDKEELLGLMLAMERIDLVAALKLSQQFPTLGWPQISTSVHPDDGYFVIPAVTWAGIGQ